MPSVVRDRGGGAQEDYIDRAKSDQKAWLIIYEPEWRRNWRTQ
jgi:hypothetical protein